MLKLRHTLLILATAGLLSGCASTGDDAGKAVAGKFRLSEGVVQIIEEEGRVDLAQDERVACVQDRVTGSQRMIRVCATQEELQSEAWRKSQFGNLATVGNLTDLENHPLAIVQ